jgi:hypothetical protein
MLSHILAEPLFLQIWIFWLVVINTGSIFFLGRSEARWVLAAWMGNVVLMTVLFELNGYNRLLGLSHIVFWTPLLVYLHRRRGQLSGDRLFDGWVRTVFVTNLLSLCVDYVDVARYLLAARS